MWDLLVGLDGMPDFIKNHIIPLVQPGAIFTLTGPLGAGKTSLAKEVFRQLGITSVVASPTFAYVKRYDGLDGQIFYHFDLYRLQAYENFAELGFEEMVADPKAICFIEWPEVIETYLCDLSAKKNIYHIFIDYLEKQQGIRQIADFNQKNKIKP